MKTDRDIRMCSRREYRARIFRDRETPRRAGNGDKNEIYYFQAALGCENKWFVSIEEAYAYYNQVKSEGRVYLRDYLTHDGLRVWIFERYETDLKDLDAILPRAYFTSERSARQYARELGLSIVRTTDKTSTKVIDVSSMICCD